MRKEKIISIFVCMLATLSFSSAIPVVNNVLAGGGWGGGGCGGGGSGGGGGIIDPAPGGPFADPVEATDNDPDPNIVDVDITAQESPININGQTATLMTYNGYYPGPTIRIHSGNILRIHFLNALSYDGTNILGFTRGPTNIHVHGMRVSPEEPGDAAHIPVNPGQTRDYEYDTSMVVPGALNFYHNHVHGLTAEQYFSGLTGTILVEDENDLLANYETHVMMIKDITIQNGEPEPYSTMMDYMHGKEGNTIMINGQVNPVLGIHKGQVQRWHILNACNARFMKLSLTSHNMYLIGTDSGGLLDHPYQVPYLLLAPGERVDVLVKATQNSGTFKFKALPYNRMGNMLSPTITLMTVQYGGSTMNQNIPSSINPDAERLNIDTSQLVHRTVVLSMGQGRGYINGQDFDVDPYMIMSDSCTYEVWTVSVEGMMDHPFHMHVNHAQIIGYSGGDTGYKNIYLNTPSWKDTILIPKGGTVTLLMNISEITGMTMFHCHIVEHEDIGMMGMWHIMGME